MNFLHTIKYLSATFVCLCVCITYTAAQEQQEVTIDTVALNKNGRQADAMFFEGVKANMQNDDKRARPFFEEFVKLKPNEPDGYYELSRITQREHNDDSSEEYIKKALALDANNKWYKVQYADILTDKNEFVEAAEIYRSLAGTDPYSSGYLVQAALLYQKAGNNKEALILLDRAITLAGVDEELLIQKEQICLKMNDVDNATKTIEQLIQMNPDDSRYYMLLADIYDNNREMQKAEEVYQRAQKTLPNDPAIESGLAEHYLKIHDTARYNEYVKKVILNKDLEVEMQVNMLGTYLQGLSNDANRKSEALSLARQISAMHPDNAKVLAIYGDILAIYDERDSAALAYKRSVALDPSKYEVWSRLLENYTDRKDADSLIRYSEKAMKLFPNQAEVHFLNGYGHSNKKEYDLAIKAINRAIDMAPDDKPDLLVGMYATLGDIYNSTKQYTLSDSCFRKALSLGPNDAGTLNNYSYYLSERGEHLDEAEKMSKRSLELRPGEATFMDTYGWILYKKGDFAGAKEYIQKAIDANPQNADGTLFDHMGNVLYKLNDKAKAVDYWRKAKEKNVDDPQIDKKIQDSKLYE